MDDLITLNNNATNHLLRGDAFEACNLLTEASHLCMKMSQLAPHRMHRKPYNIWIRWQKAEGSSDGTKLEDQDDEEDTATENVLFEKSCCGPKAFSFALVVSLKSANRGPARRAGMKASSLEEEDISRICPCSVSPIIWYNLALTCHMLGTQSDGHTSADCEFYLMRSIFLYEKVLELCSSRKQSFGPGHDFFSTTLRCSILNNMACVHYRMGRKQTSREVLRNMQTLFQTSTSLPFLIRECLQVFISNFAYICKNDSIVCAKAA